MTPSKVFDLLVSLVLLAYGVIFTVGSVVNWRRLVGSAPRGAEKPRRLLFRLFLFLIGCLLLFVGVNILRGG